MSCDACPKYQLFKISGEELDALVERMTTKDGVQLVSYPFCFSEGPEGLRVFPRPTPWTPVRIENGIASWQACLHEDACLDKKT
jgi:hypothetical protein